MAHSNSEKSKKVKNKKKHTENMVPCMEAGNNKIFGFFLHNQIPFDALAFA